MGMLMGLNLVMGLLATFDVREWPHRLQEVLVFSVYLCEMLKVGEGGAGGVGGGRDSQPPRFDSGRRQLSLLSSWSHAPYFVIL